MSLGLVLYVAVTAGCVRRYVEPDTLRSASVRFRLMNKSEFGVVQVFKNEQCDEGRFLGLLQDVDDSGPAGRADLAKQGTKGMIGSDAAAARQGFEFEKNVKGPIVFAFKWFSHSGLVKTSCPLTIAADFQDGHQYEVRFDVDRHTGRCGVVVSELMADGPPVLFTAVRQIGECTQAF